MMKQMVFEFSFIVYVQKLALTKTPGTTDINLKSQGYTMVLRSGKHVLTSVSVTLNVKLGP